VTILARIAERADQIDVGRAEEARQRAEERLAHPKTDMDYERARIALTKSLARLHVARVTGGGGVGELARLRDGGRG
jgi:F-type H+-transporting ATPase subunit epsilon